MRLICTHVHESKFQLRRQCGLFAAFVFHSVVAHQCRIGFSWETNLCDPLVPHIVFPWLRQLNSAQVQIQNRLVEFDLECIVCYEVVVDGITVPLMLCLVRDNRRNGVVAVIRCVPWLTDDCSCNASGLNRTRLCDDIEPSRALKYELSSLVKLSGGVGFVGVVTPCWLPMTALVLLDNPVARKFIAYFLRLERIRVPQPLSNGKLDGRSMNADA